MNPAVLRQQMGHSSAAMTVRYTGEIPLAEVRAGFFGMQARGKQLLEKWRVIGKWPDCTGSRLVVYNQYARAKSGRRTMAV